jgi:hypothetical protein
MWRLLIDKIRDTKYEIRQRSAHLVEFSPAEDYSPMNLFSYFVSRISYFGGTMATGTGTGTPATTPDGVTGADLLLTIRTALGDEAAETWSDGDLLSFPERRRARV